MGDSYLAWSLLQRTHLYTSALVAYCITLPPGRHSVTSTRITPSIHFVPPSTKKRRDGNSNNYLVPTQRLKDRVPHTCIQRAYRLGRRRPVHLWAGPPDVGNHGPHPASAAGGGWERDAQK